MAEISSYLHSDSMHGRQITLAVNQPITALETKGWRLASRLRQFLKTHSGRYLLVHESLAWCTERPAVVVGAQCLSWVLEGDEILLCWPLDYSVYFSKVESSGFNLIAPDSELVCGYDAAVELLQQSSDRIVIVPGGGLSTTLDSAGYPANADDRQLLTDSSRFRTSAPLSVFSRMRLPHPGHAGLIVLLLLAYLLYVLFAAWNAPVEEGEQSSVITLVPAMGQARLAPALNALRRRLRDVEVLTLYGLQRIEYSAATATVELTGETTPQGWPRLESVLRQYKAIPETTGRVWQIAIAEPVPMVPEQDLLPINVEFKRILRLANEAGLTTEIVASRSVAGTMNLTSGRFRTRRSTEMELALATPPGGVSTSLPVLVAHLRQLRPPPNGRLVSARINVAKDGSKDARLTIIVKGSPTGVAI